MKKIITLVFLILLTGIYGKSFATIYGTAGACVGAEAYLFADSTGITGSWTSSDPTVATVSAGGSYTGVVTGLSAGTATITYIMGGVVETILFTVTAAPAPISGGPLVLCLGATAALTDATPGGTWSSNDPYVATVSTTGVATGVDDGNCIIRYTVGPGCAAGINVTVNSVIVDTPGGPAVICTGTTGVFSSVTTGGVWSSSNTAIATVNSAGVVTGISAGTVMISYIVTTAPCGIVAYTGVELTVSSTTAPGIITGTTSLPVGASTSLGSTVWGGTWSSSNPAVATIDASGNVTGLTVGTSTISYAVSGCSGLAYANAVVNVTAFDGISGHVTFPSYPYFGDVKIWLIKYNSATHILSAIDSMNVYCGGSSTGVYYQFNGLGSDSFRIKADVADTVIATTGYLPTYHTSSYYWNTANVVAHTAGTADINKDIVMGFGTTSTGPGFIAGDVTMGANKGTSGSIPSVGLLIYAQDNATGVIMQHTTTDAAGHYSFSNLPIGTYRIYPELMNYATTPYNAISLTSAAPAMTAASFVQHTVSYKITPVTAAVGNITTASSYISTFPNPTSGKLNINYEVSATEQADVTVTDVTGRSVYSTTISLTKGAGNASIDLSAITNGLYMISIKSASVNYYNKVQVQK